MSNIQLEVGKTYLSRDGKKVRIIRNSEEGAYPFVGEPHGIYRPNGSYWVTRGECQADLIAEAPTEPRCHACGLGERCLDAQCPNPPQQPEQPEPIPHADLIRAVLDGKVVQVDDGAGFRDERFVPGQMVAWLAKPSPGWKFRLKPEPVVRWFSIYPENTHLMFGIAGEFVQREVAVGMDGVLKLIRLELDPDTLEVISAKTEAP